MYVHIISRGNKWAVKRRNSKRALRVLKYREEAYNYAKSISNDVIVHNKDATVLFKT